MTEKIITCITCPLGCDITVRAEGDQIVFMEGQQCKRGEKYARNEFFRPVRILTSTVKAEGDGSTLLPVRSSSPIPKDMQFECMTLIRELRVKKPVRRGAVLIPDILHTGADIIATGELE